MNACPEPEDPAAHAPAARIGTGGDAVAEQLVAAGVDTVFGLPGIQLDHLTDGLAQRSDRLSFIASRHEQGAAYMADGYARATGRPGVVTVVPGPGVLNASAGLATAFACSSPVVCLAGQISAEAIGRGLGLLHDLAGQDDVLRAVTKQTTTVESTSAIPGAVQRALTESLSGRPRPVAVQLPDSVLAAPYRGAVERSPLTGVRAAPNPDLVARAVRALEGARHPVIYAGGGAVSSGATPVLADLAARIGAPVVMSPNGRGALSDRDPWALTALGGRRVLPRADVVLAVGTRFLETNGRPVSCPSADLILINADEADLGLPRTPTVAIEADARLSLEDILAGVRASRSEWQAGDVAATRSWCSAQIDGLADLADYVRALRAGIAEDGILVGDLTQVGYASRVAYPVYAPRTYVTAGYMGSLGFALPTAIGVKVGRPGVPVVSVSGDGGFAYAFAELLTAVAHHVAVTAVVFNDNAYGNVLRTQLSKFDGRVIGTRLHNPDFMTLAKALGVPGLRATSPPALTGALRDAASAAEPLIIEVPVGSFADPARLVRDAPRNPT